MEKSNPLHKKGFHFFAGVVVGFLTGCPVPDTRAETYPVHIPSPQIETLMKTAAEHLQNGQFDQAVQNLKKVLVIYQEKGRQEKAASTRYDIGLLYQNWGKLNEAEEQYGQVLQYYKEKKPVQLMADTLVNLGMIHQTRGEYEEAIEIYERAVGVYEEIKIPAGAALALSNIGTIYKSKNLFQKAEDYQKKALSLYQNLKNEGGTADAMSNLGAIYQARGQYKQAIQFYKDSRTINKKLKRAARFAKNQNDIGGVYQDWGEFDKALSYFEKSLKINRHIKNQEDISINLNNIGVVYQHWGLYQKAIRYFKEGLETARKIGSEREVATYLTNMGWVYNEIGEFENAIEANREALEIDKKLGKPGGVALALDNIGLVYQSWGKYDQAIEYHLKALEMNKDLGRQDILVLFLHNLGLAYNNKGQYEKALEVFKEALVIDRKFGQKSLIADSLNYLGGVHFNRKEYQDAIDYLVQSVEVKEQLRLTATGTVRRDYLASQIETYQTLISSYINVKDNINGFSAIEQSRARLLMEKLAASQTQIQIPEVREIQSQLGPDVALLIYANMVEKISPALHMKLQPAVLLITDRDLQSRELVIPSAMATVLTKYQTNIKFLMQNSRGLKKVKTKKKESLKMDRKDDLESLVNFYRNLLTHPAKANQDPTRDVARALYDFLIHPVESQLRDKKELIIIPDGVLGFLPFETLISEEGRYLVEKIGITYAQSMGVMDIIRKRKYSPNRKPLLAFGGAVYSEASYDKDMIQNEAQLRNLEQKVQLAMIQTRSMRDAYGSLGIGKWKNLPGTLAEVKAIDQLIPGSKVLTGTEVNETTLKTMSENEELSSYRVIHFATHGLVVPALPELSAMVLSLLEQETEEDGYLRMSEIAQLRLKADFVNLSACETGLGKIYGGEGVVGLTQSFLIAGANGLSVSLWSVADESTMIFMVGMYRLVQDKGLSYGEAINEMKRAFIKGQFEILDKPLSGNSPANQVSSKKEKSYVHPYYWAPFVYYGKN